MIDTDRIARLALEDGTVLQGRSIGADGTRYGEVVFNTSLTGYQEILTDPSYCGQMVVMTAPHIGNTGMNPQDDEARRPFLSGLIIRSSSPVVSNWRATESLSDWLVRHDIPAISDIDTRALTRRLRCGGTLKGVLTTDPAPLPHELVEMARVWPGLDGVDLVEQVTCDAPYEWTEPTDARWAFNTPGGWQTHPEQAPVENDLHVVAFDFGIKRNMLRRLRSMGCKVTVVPARTSASEVLAMQPDGVLLSNGPGDPAAVQYAVDTVRTLLDKLPIFGICLGHQILGQAVGGRTYRLKFGHHGGNQPVRQLRTGRVEISAHNHNFAVDPESLPADVEMSHQNLNDGCCEGLRHKTLPVMSVQYHPEAAPGPHDADPTFADFVRAMRSQPVVVGGEARA